MPSFVFIEKLTDPQLRVFREGKLIPAPGTFFTGDVLLGNRPLHDPVIGHQLATLNFRGTIIQEFNIPAGDVLFGVNAEVHFNTGGMLAIQDSFRFSTTESYGAIVGGTGVFARARGEVRREVLDFQTIEFTYHVITS
jgi:hypothetical protein